MLNHHLKLKKRKEYKSYRILAEKLLSEKREKVRVEIKAFRRGSNRGNEKNRRQVDIMESVNFRNENEASVFDETLGTRHFSTQLILSTQRIRVMN